MILKVKFTATFAFAAVLGAVSIATAQQKNDTVPGVPIISLTAVPLTDAIASLARGADLNYILDPKLPRTAITFRRENMAAKQALGELLKENNLFMVENTNTSVARITATKPKSKPLELGQLGDVTNAVIPRIVMDDIPLDAALQNLIQAGHLIITLDVKLSGSSPVPGQFVRPATVSVRWQNLTAKQAIGALIENYDLAVVKDPTTSALQITKAQQDK